MCLYWIRKYAKNIEAKETPNTRVNDIEMDELYSFVERKNRFYAITLVSRDTRGIVGFDIAFDKSRDRSQRLEAVPIAPKFTKNAGISLCFDFFSDEWPDFCTFFVNIFLLFIDTAS